jgi:hypothetical protein
MKTKFIEFTSHITGKKILLNSHLMVSVEDSGNFTNIIFPAAMDKGFLGHPVKESFDEVKMILDEADRSSKSSSTESSFDREPLITKDSKFCPHCGSLLKNPA